LFFVSGGRGVCTINGKFSSYIILYTLGEVNLLQHCPKFDELLNVGKCEAIVHVDLSYPILVR
jgi:hypothetical protein